MSPKAPESQCENSLHSRHSQQTGKGQPRPDCSMVASGLAAKEMLGSFRAGIVGGRTVVVARHGELTQAIVAPIECRVRTSPTFTQDALSYSSHLLPESDLRPHRQRQMQLDQLRLLGPPIACHSLLSAPQIALCDHYLA